jgi:hypothetical protein
MKLLRLHNRQFNLPCLHSAHDGCDDRLQSEKLSSVYIQKLLLNLTHPLTDLPSRSTQTIFLFNYGLHVLTPKIGDWSLRGMIDGIMKTIQEQRVTNVTFLYRETSSQVFASSKGF